MKPFFLKRTAEVLRKLRYFPSGVMYPSHSFRKFSQAFGAMSGNSSIVSWNESPLLYVVAVVVVDGSNPSMFVREGSDAGVLEKEGMFWLVDVVCVREGN